MPLKRVITRRNDGVTIEDNDETKKTKKTVSVIPSTNYLVCDKCKKSLVLRVGEPVTIECSSCGHPWFHTSSGFTVQCVSVNCNNTVNIKEKFNGTCSRCKRKIWKTV